MNEHQVISAIERSGVKGLQAIRVALREPETYAKLGIDQPTPEVIEQASKLIQDATIAINLKHLKAAAHIMAKNDIRYYLCGVLVEATPTQTVLSATDGHVLIALRHKVSNDALGTVRMIVPDSIVGMITKSGAKGPPEAIIHRTDVSRWSTPLWAYGGAEVQFSQLEGKFPNWKHVIPKATSGEVAQFNPDILTRLKRAFSEVCGKRFNSMHIKHNGDGGAVIISEGIEEIVAVAMPMRCSSPFEPSTPEWAK